MLGTGFAIVPYTITKMNDIGKVALLLRVGLDEPGIAGFGSL